MNDPDPRPTDEQLAALLRAADKDAPAPDRAFLERLRDRSLAAFVTAAPSPPPLARKRSMLPLPVRWIAASAAALLVLGIVIAQWFVIRNQPAPAPEPDEQFVFSDGLVEDGRIGKVTDAQGVVAVKPVTHERWSPVQPRLILKPGDWLRTDSRGANAVALKLIKSAAVIVGPHSTVELVKANEIRLLAGEIEVSASADAPVELNGPDKQKVSIGTKQHFRVENEKLVRVEEEPRWLQGFRGTTATESVGSLVATVDGRDVPLTVGYHHVTVDIRDQIARTTIEESFVNTTRHELEGVFYFPLPQDASISGFGMWIGDQLVEADVVEKQRAREIYETILREKRDPGLLEWAGGNIFKARVYPIPGRAEKRIKITYTQVLPLRGNRYQYSYALQSELLKQHPLRDLKIDVKVNSTAPIKSLTSPTHPARVAKTDRSGHVEFSAQEYTPTRDFEAVIEVDGARADVVVVPHRRGDDGYFMVQLTPPGSPGDWDRPLVPNGDPLRLLLIADTSASMDQGQRAARTAALTALLGALTPKDTVNVAACDVNCNWIFEKPVPATPANIATIQDSLAKRTSLGWTDLDKAFASALNMSAPGTHIVYFGDGITTTGTADPVAFAQRLQRLYEGKSGTAHAVALGSSYESATLKAIASLGGGSVRRVSGERSPQATAFDLLTEIATPVLRDVKVEFTGLRTARVYPDTLPNVPAGTQQILLGRYLPEGKDQSGEIIVTGMIGSKPVRYVSKISLQDADQGNSFVPRLWARMHLDKLLEQGTSETVKRDVIALSEEFNIITPYTSLLVLESDADRERFAVKRRFQMRDGEKFFATGRDTAMFELKQKQMQRAGDYRTALRRSVLAQLNALGRDARLFRNRLPGFPSSSTPEIADSLDEFYGVRGLPADGKRSEGFATYSGDVRYEEDDPSEWREKGKDSLASDFASAGRLIDTEGGYKYEEDEKFGEFGFGNFGRENLRAGLELAPARPDLRAFQQYDMAGIGLRDYGFVDLSKAEGGWSDELGRFRSYPGKYDRRGRGRLSQLPWLGTLFPALVPPAREPKEPKTLWPAPALALSRSLLRKDKLAQVKGGIIIARQTDSFDRRGEVSSRGTRLDLVSPAAWLTRTAPDGGQVLVSWCDAKECGAYSTAFQLGRVRASNQYDLRYPPLGFADHSVTALHVTFANMTPVVEAVAKDRELLILKRGDSPDHETRVLIDTTRHVVLSIEGRYKNKVTSTTKFGDFVEVAGQWWAQRVETFDAEQRRTSRAQQTVTEARADEFAKRTAQELAGKSKVLFLKQPLVSVATAKAAVAAGKATFDDRAVLVLHFAASQQWARALEHFQECERLAGDKVGARWLRTDFLLASRRHDDLRQRLLDDAAALAATTDPDTRANDYFLAEHLVGLGAHVLQVNEQLLLSDALQNVDQRQPAHLEALKTSQSRRVSLLERAGQSDKALALARELAVNYPRDYYRQYTYAQALAETGDYPAAYAWLERVLAPAAHWAPDEENVLREQFVGFLRQQGRYLDLAKYLGTWTERNPAGEQPYAQYLSALVLSNQAPRAEALVAQWLRDARIEGTLPAPVEARLRAASYFALGQGYNLSTNRVDERWHAPLAETALFFARSDDYLTIVSNILHSSRFSSTDAARAARRTLAELLVKEIDTMSIARIDYFMSWVWTHSGTERDEWNKVVAGLRRRWGAEKDAHTKHRIAQSLVRALGWISDDDVLAFRRVQWKEGPEEYRASYANELFSALLARPWSAEIENEALALLDKLAGPEDPAHGLPIRVAALYRLTDAMLEGRFQALMKTVERPDQLTRADLQKKHDENRKLAREGFSDRLRQEAARHAPPFANWIVAERVWIDVLLDRALKAAADDCWAILAAPPVKARPEDDNSSIEVTLDEILRDRALVVLQNLAARKGADPGSVDRLVKYIDQQMKDSPEDTRWRAEKYRLLIALDRVADLEAELGRWAGERDSDGRWRLALGYLLAEQGKVGDAIKQFEALEAADELSPAAYRSLAEWYLVENRRAQHEKARAAVYNTTEEHQLTRQLHAHLSPWQNHSGALPTQLDPEVLNIFRALFEKSASLQNYLQYLKGFYQGSRDFRLLSMLPDGTIGHSANKVYPFLQAMRSVLNEVRAEATADELVARIAQVRPLAKTVVDQRALDLLELQVERRAAELQNQPGPHADKALAALERAFKGEWAPGEARLMADFLAVLGAVPQPAIAKEQLRQLEVLHRGAGPGSFDRLHIAQQFATALDAYSRRAEAMDLLEAALKEFEGANKGALPVSAHDALMTLVTFTERAGHYERGEKLLLAQLKHPLHETQKNTLTERLNELYQRALTNKGSVSLGRGDVLYKALGAKLLADLVGAGQNHRYQVLNRLIRVYCAARDLKVTGVADDLKAFAFNRFPDILKEQTVSYSALVRETAQALRDVVGAREGLTFLLDRAENEPDWVRYTDQDAWAAYSHSLGHWRTEAKELGALEGRLLKLVLGELRRDLRSGVSRDRMGYDRRHNYFWPEKVADFARVADEVLAERKASSASVEFIAAYLFSGLAHEKRAIEILLAAHAQKILSEPGQWLLIGYLHQENRFAESIPLLLPLVATHPAALHYRTKLMHAYFRTGKHADLMALLKQTDEFFHTKGQWTESALAALGYSCLENRLFAQAVAYYEELIPVHQRTAPRRGIGDGVLSSYYTHAARAFAGLGKTKQAVDMASGAVVSWGARHEQRGQALAVLVEVLAGAPDLGAYVAELDKEKLQSAVVRKAIGKAYVQKNDHARAVPQLQLASELQPNDAEIFEALVACYDKIGDQDGAVRQLLRAVELSRREIKFYEQLGRRFGELDRSADAERAYTSVVEVLPNESEGHALLAAIREKQNRWPDAIAHWERVAEIRALEPTGLLKLAAAQIEHRDWDSAAKTLRKLRTQSWPQRFSDVEKDTRALERKLDARPK